MEKAVDRLLRFGFKNEDIPEWLMEKVVKAEEEREK